MVTLCPEGEGARIEVASDVRSALSLSLVERAAARRRRTDIERRCERLDSSVE